MSAIQEVATGVAILFGTLLVVPSIILGIGTVFGRLHGKRREQR